MNALFPMPDTVATAPVSASADPAACIHAAALLLFPHIERETRVDAAILRGVMTTAFTAYGLFHEIISWKLRMFVPIDVNGLIVLGKVLERWPVERVGEREAA